MTEGLPQAEAPAPHEITVGPVTQYTPEVAAGIGRLMHELDPSFSDEPISQEWLEETIADPNYAQLVALRNGEVVGAATMSTIREPGFGAKGFLGAFIVDASARGSGIADALWDEMHRWCRERGYPAFEFDTEEERPDAVRFYEKRGARRIAGSMHFEKDVA